MSAKNIFLSTNVNYEAYSHCNIALSYWLLFHIMGLCLIVIPALLYLFIFL